MVILAMVQFSLWRIIDIIVINASIDGKYKGGEGIWNKFSHSSVARVN
jgi:hypothetical protein